MIDAAHFELIRRRHGAYASWAVWAPSSGPPKSNMGDLGVLSEHRNPALLETLNPGVVMVGLNVAARSLASEPFRNFHDPSPVANDFKIRFAFAGTEFWGAYMTDVIKNHPETQSKRLLVHLKAHPEEIHPHIERFRAELHDLGCARPVILAFGQATYRLLKKHLGVHEYSRLLLLTHYSHRISKENYQKAVLTQIERARPPETEI